MAIIGDKSIKELEGVIISAKNDKTRTVLVKTVKLHDLYKKRFVVSKKYYVHDAENVSKEWDTVVIREGKMYSKNKRWVLIKVL